jgi:uncharacterized membrane protein
MTAATALVTMLFQVAIPATRGYFNLGESMVYVSALLFGPTVGAFSGGIGSMLSDVFTGYIIYAPGTLVIKGIEGFIVGSLAQRAKIVSSRGKENKLSTRNLLVTVASCVAIEIFLEIMGISGVTFSFLDSEFIIGPYTWILVSILAALLVGYMINRFGSSSFKLILSMLAGGTAMVIGYFLYELPLFGLANLVEVPFNIMQCISGIVIALPIYRRVRQALAI